MKRVIHRLLPFMLAFMMLAVTAIPACGENAPWDCPQCGRTGNTGNFCGGCGTKAPAEQTEATAEKPEEPAETDFVYSIAEDGTAVIDRYTGSAGDLVIPDTLGGRKVTAIGESTFELCESLTSVTIPEGVQRINHRAFWACEALTEITIPDSVTSIGDDSFGRCGRLTKITVSPEHPYLVVIDGALYSKPDKRLVCYPPAHPGNSFTISDGIQIIGGSAFYYSSSLTKITIPDSVTQIGSFAFYGCTSLAGITIPDSVTYIGDGAFNRCESLTSIVIPDSICDMGVNPFVNCSELKEITVSPEHPYLATTDGVLFGKTDKRLICYPCVYTAKSYAIPNGTEIIGENSFISCKSLTEITIPDSVKCIDFSAFQGCESLISLVIPDSVTHIGMFAFSGCKSLEKIMIPDSVTQIEYRAFAGCSDELTVTVSSGSYAEQYCKENNLKYMLSDAVD